MNFENIECVSIHDIFSDHVKAWNTLCMDCTIFTSPEFEYIVKKYSLTKALYSLIGRFEENFENDVKDVIRKVENLTVDYIKLGKDPNPFW